MRTFDLTGGQRTIKEEPALLQQPVRKIPWWYLHFHLWTAMQHIAYFVAPASGCPYCLAWRMFFIGMFVGMELMWLFPKIKVW